MKLLKYIFFTAAILMSSLALYAGETVKYVFLFIGDGMSIPQRMTAEEFSRINTGKGLAMNSMPHQALTITRSKNSFITDSAASGTAIACGVKTKNGAIGVGADGSRLQSIAEVARDSGRKVGILTSVTLNHATPASFYGHNPSRGNYYELGLDMIASGFDFFGGRRHRQERRQKIESLQRRHLQAGGKGGIQGCAPRHGISKSVEARLRKGNRDGF